MSDVSPSASDQDDYATILAAVMETERGRWFLAEFARRNRHAETGRVLDAIARLEMVLAPAAPAPRLLPLAAPAVVAPASVMPSPAPRPAVAIPPPAPGPATEPATEPCADSTGFAAIDALSVDARLRMFH